MADNTLGTVLKFGLLGGAAWIAWNIYQSMANPAGAVSSTAGGTGTAGGGATTPPATPAAPTSTFVAQLTAKANANPLIVGGQATVSQWNYLLTQIWGAAPQITSATPAGDNPISAQQYVAYYIATPGFKDPSITSGVSGLGAIMGRQSRRNYVPVFAGMPARSHYVRRVLY